MGELEGQEPFGPSLPLDPTELIVGTILAAAALGFRRRASRREQPPGSVGRPWEERPHVENHLRTGLLAEAVNTGTATAKTGVLKLES
jgi:hypothetical protein